MKKYVLVLALLVAIVPFALAERSGIALAGDADGDAKVSIGARGNDADASTDSHVESKVRINIGDGERQARLEKQKELQEQRNLTLGRQIQQVVREARSEIKGERKELTAELKTKMQECRSKKTKDCQDARAEIKRAIRETLILASEKTDAMVESIKQLVGNSQASDKAEVTAKLEAKAAALAQAKLKAESINENSSAEEVRNVSAMLRAEVEATAATIREQTARIMSERLGGVLQKSKNLEMKLENIVAMLEAKGVNTSTIDVSVFKAKLSAAAEMKVQADAQVETAASLHGREKGQALKEAAAKMRESHKLVKEAHAELKKIVTEIKAKQGGSATVEASANASAQAGA
ncbi:hypothetical protein J4211_01875 [Candidatus Woesearchaeota archaeon]|nr:hypothetical protein [Candidatus Woesearchaeota archaeon]